MERERKRKEKGKGKEKERERKKNARGKGKGTEKETKKERKKERKKDRKKERRRKRKRKGRNRKKEKKGREKGEKRERKREKGSVSHGAFLMSKVFVFIIVWLSFVNPVCVCVPFLGNGCNHQKRSLATTYQAPSLCRICAITTTNNERKIPRALNSRRMMEKSRTLDFKRSGHRSLT